MDWLDWLLLVAQVVIVFFALLISVLLYIWFERKVIADMQTRMGPMRAGPHGLLITLADGIKLFFKEGILPTNADRPVYLSRRSSRCSRRSSRSQRSRSGRASRCSVVRSSSSSRTSTSASSGSSR